jgi:hypothetical protein
MPVKNETIRSASPYPVWGHRTEDRNMTYHVRFDIVLWYIRYALCSETIIYVIFKSTWVVVVEVKYVLLPTTFMLILIFA